MTVLKGKLAGLILIFLFISGCGQANVIARVNGQEITLEEFNRMVKRVEASYQGMGLNLAGKGEHGLAAIRKDILDGMIENILVSEEVRKLNLSPVRQEIESAVQKIKDSYKDEKEFQAALQKSKLTVKDLKTYASQQLSRQKLMEAVTKEIAVSEPEIKIFYDSNPGQFYRDGKKQTLEEVKAEVRDYLLELKKQEKFDLYLSRLVGGAKIEINDKLLKNLELQKDKKSPEN